MDLSEVVATLKLARPDLPIEEVTGYLVQEYSGEGATAYFDREVVEALPASPDAVGLVLHLLSGSPFHVVESRWQLCDSTGSRIDLQHEDVEHARLEGALRHPHSGALVDEGACRLQRWYESGRTLDAVFYSDAE